jgi:starch-binding outer membrane protein, SusD/RagB family
MKKHMNNIIYYLLIGCVVFSVSCKKAVEIPPPINTITSTQVFATDQQATSAMAGIYLGMIDQSSGLGPFNSQITIWAGASADEFLLFDPGATNFNLQFQNNTLLSTNYTILGSLWAPAYSTIYGCNSMIADLQSSKTVDDSTKSELTGEAEFVRAFANFYLTNLFGDPPLVTSINYQKTSLLPNSNSATIYNAIVSDLKDAISKLHQDYSAGKGQKVVPNKWAASALLARTYLFLNDWTNAQKQATAVINTGLYSLSPLGGTSQVFSPNSSEAIWQLQQVNADYNFGNATPEGYTLLPYNDTSPLYVYLTTNFLSAIETGDQRQVSWVGKTNYLGTDYYYPNKYKIGPGNQTLNGPYSEYYMVLRLAEQYLIRAEAEARLGDLADAANDLNMIRNRAGLPNVTASGQTDLLAAIAHENQIEFFAEWGHRWFDLKRTGQATTVLAPLKPKWKSTSVLYPIPFNELQTNPNLKQNPGY